MSEKFKAIFKGVELCCHCEKPFNNFQYYEDDPTVPEWYKHFYHPPRSYFTCGHAGCGNPYDNDYSCKFCRSIQ